MAFLAAHLRDALDDNGFGGTVTVTFNATTDFDILVVDAAVDSMLIYDDSGATTLITIAATDSNGCPVVELTTNFQAFADFCNIPVGIVEPEGVTMTVTPMCGWDCNMDVVEPQSLVYEQGNGAAVKAQEFESRTDGGHWYIYTGLPTTPDPSRTLYADESNTYTVYTIEHIDRHEGAPSGS